MHAIRLHTFGPAEHLTYEEAPDPAPAPGQVRIAVTAAGVHLLDTAIRAGIKGPLPELPELPTIPGREVAGTVESLGEGVDPALLGKRVVAHIGFAPGGYAELVVTEASRLHELPEDLDDAQAVALIGTGRTTMGILRFAELTPDSVAVIPAAAGGIGTLLVQYAKHAGATVIGLAGGPEKTDRVATYGADLAVDYRNPDWPDEAHAFLTKIGVPGATVVFDGVGGASGLAAVDLLAPGGTHLVFGWSGKGPHDGEPLTLTDEQLAARGITQLNVLGPVMMRKAGGDNPIRTLELAALAEAAKGHFTPAVQRYPLSKAATAHADLENRRTTGKVVLIP
ncbi:zinc-binding dehydrogenase [Streptomyces durmitorensis]|uniref:Zinc-binding dehydrogenase n=1 Tax=Streptomyces durmitorensis TaxID=319947 RepID=A0ABY4PW46_9ACTN|nr:zinc-binding dehydrogenase [Streptomyces durmitorensis]UQT57791.1 zinc-binding dehydrogenase [Streptomyces durmitorensis]